MKKIYTSLLFVMNFVLVFAQTGTGIGAKVVDSKTFKPLQNVVASIQNTNLTELTDVKGRFVFKNVPVGKGLLQLRSNGYKDQLMTIDIENGKIQDIGTVQLEEDLTVEQQLSTVTISDTELNDEGNGSENTSSLLQSSRDTFLQAAAFNFGQARFSVRGIDNEYANVMINSISMNRIADGRPQYGDWGGLNDATRNQEFSNGSAPSDYVFGGIAGTQEINTRASVYRKGTRLSFLNTNTNYSFRAMGTHVSGMQTNGWAYVISASQRWSNEGYFEGTNYNANSLFASVEKKFSENHSLNFTSIYAQNLRDKNSPNTDEINDLVGEKYNSYWGYQDGKKRNSRFKKSEEPLLMLTHYWKINSKTNLNSTISYQIGQIGNSRLDYKYTDSPDPVYYKNLPSYYTTLYTGNLFTPNLQAAALTKANFIADPQINWNSIYNDINIPNKSNGSRVVLYEDRNDENILNGNLNLTSKLSDNIFMAAGLNYLDSKTKNFKNLLDLLGGDFYEDRGSFGFGNQQQNDLNNPNRRVIVNDKYGYNYNIYASRLDAFTQFKFLYKKIDFYLAQTFSQSSFQREGLYKNGYFENNSFGTSDEIIFENFGFKGGITYKINGKNYIDFNSIYMTKSPNAKDIFPNTRVNNNITENISNEKIKGADLSYIIRTPKLKARITGYFNEVLNSTDINFYYSDDLLNGSIGAFVSEVVTGINKKNRGGEFGLEYQLNSTIKLSGVAAYGEYIYTNNPNLKLFDDSNQLNLNNKNDKGAAKLEGLKLPGMPQQAYSLAVEYRDPKFWWIGVNANYLSDTYLDVSSLKRTSSYYDPIANTGVVIDQEKAEEFLKQEKFSPIRLLNLVGGKSWRIARKYNIGIFANVNNILDYKYKTGGFEQSRSASYKNDIEDRSGGGLGSFAPKYFQGYGRTYSVNLSLTF
jgi:CarboxypepD_reg-like domain